MLGLLLCAVTNCQTICSKQRGILFLPTHNIIKD